MHDLAKLFDEKHLQSTLSVLALIGAAFGALIVVSIALSHIALIIVTLAVFGGLAAIARVWLK